MDRVDNAFCYPSTRTIACWAQKEITLVEPNDAFLMGQTMRPISTSWFFLWALTTWQSNNLSLWLWHIGNETAYFGHYDR